MCSSFHIQSFWPKLFLWKLSQLLCLSLAGCWQWADRCGDFWAHVLIALTVSVPFLNDDMKAQALQKQNKHPWWWTLRIGMSVWLSLRGQSCIQNSSCLQWEWEEEEESKPGTLPLSAKARTSSCWNCELGRTRQDWVGILPQNQNFNLRFSLSPFLMIGIC